MMPAAIGALLGPSLTAIAVPSLQVATGTLLLLFGTQRLRKAMLRARIPENALKLALSVMVCAFGTFWFGEGVGIQWPQGDAAILAIIVAFLAAAVAGTALARRIAHPSAAAP